MNKATPGPWEVIRGRCGPSVEVFGAGKAITEMWDRGDKETQQANARLIAAAPEMLHALQEMIANCDRWLETGIPADATESKRLYDQMVEAVKKATGGE